MLRGASPKWKVEPGGKARRQGSAARVSYQDRHITTSRRDGEQRQETNRSFYYMIECCADACVPRNVIPTASDLAIDHPRLHLHHGQLDTSLSRRHPDAAHHSPRRCWQHLACDAPALVDAALPSCPSPYPPGDNRALHARPWHRCPRSRVLRRVTARERSPLQRRTRRRVHDGRHK